MQRYAAILLAAAAVALGIYWFLTAPSRARKETSVATATAATAEGSKAAAQDAVKILVETQAAHGRIDVITQGNRDAIFAAPGAGDAVNAGVHNAGIAAVCLRDTYRLQPSCQRLLHLGAASAGGPDAGSPAAK